MPGTAAPGRGPTNSVARFLPRFRTTSLLLSGVARDAGNAPLASVTVKLMRTRDDALIDEAVSAVDGTFSFTMPSPNETYYVVGYLVGSPDRAGTTLNTLVGS